MATVASTLYPPQVETFMPAFIYTDAVKVYFSISTFNTVTDIRKIHISVVDQKTNKNALRNPLGFIFKDFQKTISKNKDESTGLYYVEISPNELATAVTDTDENGNVTVKTGNEWNINQFYKIQLRFDQHEQAVGETVLESMSVSDQAKYLNENGGEFSEWSSVCLIRPIAIPDITLTSMEQNTTGEDAPAYNKGFVPIVGQLTFSIKNGGDTSIITYETEKLQSYYLTIATSATQEVLWTSDTYYTSDNVDPNSFSCRIDLSNIKEVQASDSEQGGGAYCLNIHYTTTDEYMGVSSDYKFDITDYLVGDWDPTAWFKVDNEEGKIKLHIENVQTSVVTALFITRSSNLSSYQTWETVAAYNLSNTSDLTIFEYEDKTVGSHIWYRYKLQGRNSAGVYTDSINFSERYSDSNIFAFPTFYDAMLYRNDQQLDIRYDFKISSYKQTVNRTKFDTLGGKYPKFAENAAMKYKQFSISGLIASEADVNQHFINKEKYFTNNGEFANGTTLYNEYLTDEEILSLERNDFLPSGLTPDAEDNKAEALESNSYGYKTTTWRDYLWEREFRESALNWLNDGEPKLFKSMTEGIMAVMLMDVSLTPNANLGRMTYSFSATAYEIADGNSLETLDSLGIVNIPGVGDDDIDSTDIETIDTYPRQRVGQLYKPNITSEGIDLITQIIAQELLTYYQGIRGSYYPIVTDGELYLNNLKIQFTTAPRGLVDPGQQHVRFDTGDSNTKNPYIGYQLRINSVIVDEDSVDTSTLTQDDYIFVNHNGYYQVPTVANTYHLALPDAADLKDENNNIANPGDKAVFDYILNYRVRGSEQVVSKTSVVKTIVGQYSDIFAVNESYGSVFRAKYSFVHQTENNQKAWYQYMNYFKGVCFDITPYSVVSVKYYDEDNYHQYMIGETGILHLLGDTPVQDIKFLGRKFVKKEQDNTLWYIGNTMQQNASSPILREYEYYFDDSVDPDWIYGTTLAKKWHDIDGTETEDTVFMQFEEDGVTTDIDGEDQITNLWHQISSDDKSSVSGGYTAFTDITHPKVNYVYRINNSYYIYYIDGEWYPVTMAGLESSSSNPFKQQKTIIAEIPPQGHVDFKGQILKTWYEQTAVLDQA